MATAINISEITADGGNLNKT